MASGNVEKLYTANAADYADNVLEQAVGDLKSVVLIGRTHDGAIDLRATNDLDHAQIIFLMELAKHAYLLGGDNG